MRTKNKKLGLLILTIFAEAYLIANIVGIQTNILYLNGNWESQKMLLAKGVIGSVSYFVTLPALAGNQLDLGAWNGYQEIVLKKKVSPIKIQFKFYLEQNTYLDFLYNGNDINFSGIRLSSSEKYPNISYDVDFSGKFISQSALTNTLLKANYWHSFQLIKAGQIYNISLDNRLLYEGNHYKDSQLLGFRGSAKHSYVDNITITQADNSVFFESFENNQVRIVIFTILIVVFMTAAYLGYILRRAHLTTGYSTSQFIRTHFIFIVCLIIFNLINMRLATWYPDNPDNINWYGFESNMDNKSTVLSTIHYAYSKEKLPNVNRILFLGTSQTWGAGASYESNTLVQQFSKKLSSQKNNHQEYQVINAGISGSTATELFDFYSKEWIFMHPNTVILNLSNNDTNYILFRQILDKFAHLNKTMGITTVFILEPNSVEVTNENLTKNHLIMQDIALKYTIPVVNMHEELSKYSNQGFLWWDSVHLTDYGQDQFAEILFKSMPW